MTDALFAGSVGEGGDCEMSWLPDLRSDGSSSVSVLLRCFDICTGVVMLKLLSFSMSLSRALNGVMSADSFVILEDLSELVVWLSGMD